MRPASTLERSRISLISDSRWRPEERMSSVYSACFSFNSQNIFSLNTSEKPMMALGYTFRPRRSKSRKGKYFINFSPAISDKAANAIREEIRGWKLHARSDKAIDDLA